MRKLLSAISFTLMLSSLVVFIACVCMKAANPLHPHSQEIGTVMFASALVLTLSFFGFMLTER